MEILSETVEDAFATATEAEEDVDSQENATTASFFGHQMADCQKKKGQQRQPRNGCSVDRSNNGGHQRKGGKNNGKGKDESEVVLAMVKMEDLTKTNELLDFGYCDDICDNNRDKSVCIASICDRAYNTDQEEAKKKLLKNLI
jgi:hypothetical protein